MKFDLDLSKSSVTRNRKDEIGLHDISGEEALGLDYVLDLERKDMKDEQDTNIKLFNKIF